MAVMLWSQVAGLFASSAEVAALPLADQLALRDRLSDAHGPEDLPEPWRALVIDALDKASIEIKDETKRTVFVQRHPRYAPDQSRDDHGRFSAGGGEGFVHGSPVDIERSPAISAAIAKARDRDGYISGTDLTRALAHEVGFDGPPTLSSPAEITTAIAHGEAPLYRGVEAREFADGLLTGPDGHVSSGVFGSGVYIATAETEDQARRFAGDYAHPMDPSTGEKMPGGWLIRGSLMDGARIVDWKVALQSGTAEALEWSAKKREAEADGRYSDAEYAHTMGRVLWSDPSVWAITHGYDAIRGDTSAGAYSNPDAHDYLCVLNRTALRLQRELIPAGKPDSDRRSPQPVTRYSDDQARDYHGRFSKEDGSSRVDTAEAAKRWDPATSRAFAIARDFAMGRDREEHHQDMVALYAAEIGAAGKPIVSTTAEVDAALAAGERPVYRGIAKQEWADELMHGESARMKVGAYGTGIYFATGGLASIYDASDYSIGDEGTVGYIVRASLPADAKIIPFEEAYRAASEETAAWERKTIASPLGSAEREENGAKTILFGDVTVWALSHGYDAISDNNIYDTVNWQNGSRNLAYLTVVNRTALRIDSEVRLGGDLLGHVKTLPKLSRQVRYSDDQPRVPAGSPDGGEFTSGGSGGGEFTSGGSGGWSDPGASPHEKMPADISSWPRDKQSEWFDANHERVRKWEAAISSGVALGKIDPKDAEARGWDSPTGGKPIEPLPPTLYHATVALDAIMSSSGLKTQDELATDGTKANGLGGGSSDTISFTTNREYADRIAETIIESHDVATGAITVADLEQRARDGGFYDAMKKSYDGLHGQYDLTFGQGLHYEYSSSGNAGGPPKEGEGWSPYGKGWAGGDGQMKYNEWTRPLTADEAQESRFALYQSFLTWQGQAGGPSNPVFWMADPKYYAGIDTSQVGVVTAHPIDGAKGYFVNPAEWEWRTWSGRAVTIERDRKVATRAVAGLIARYASDQARDDHGRFASGGGSGAIDMAPVVAVLRSELERLGGRSYIGTSEGGDKVLSAIAEQRGPNVPQVVTGDELDRRIAQGWTPLVRGDNYSDNMRKADNYGMPMRYGTGTYGNGVYTFDATAKGTSNAVDFGGFPPRVMRMALDPSAKVIDERTAREYANGAWLKYQDDADRLNKFNDPEFRLSREAEFDAGRWAALHGYDAMRVPDERTSYGVGVTVILNIAKVAVQDRDMTAEEIVAKSGLPLESVSFRSVRYSPDQPRDHGRFASVEGSPVDTSSLAEKAKADPLGYYGNSSSSTGSEFMADVARLRGIDGPPRVADEMEIEKLRTQGWSVWVRGFEYPDHAAQFRTGDVRYGDGVYGRGYYAWESEPSDGTDPGIEASTPYRGPDEDGPLVKFALPPDAKIIDYGDALSGYTDDDNTVRSNAFDAILQRDPEWDSSPWRDAWEDHPALTPSEHLDLARVSDVGAWALTKGYDAIKVTGLEIMPVVVLLNRSIATVQRRDIAHAEWPWERMPTTSARYAPDQPRDDHGRFADGSGGGSIDHLLVVAERVAREHGGEGEAAYRPDPVTGMHLFSALAKERGTDGLPRVGSSSTVDAAIKAGAREMYHAFPTPGGRFGQSSMAQETYTNQFRTGPMYWSPGDYGSGFYTAVTPRDTTYFGDRVVRMALDSDAKTIKWDDAVRGWKSDTHPRTDTGDNPYLDVGSWALVKGYDAITIPSSETSAGEYLNVLNRSKLTVENVDHDQWEYIPKVSRQVRYADDQPRVPAGEHGGGQFAHGEGTKAETTETGQAFTADETEATLVWTQGHDNAYRYIQTHPRSPVAKAFDRAMRKAPVVTGTVYRGLEERNPPYGVLSAQEAGKLWAGRVGQLVTFHEPVSATTDAKIAASMGHVVLEITPRDGTARDVSGSSKYSEHEAVLGLGTYRVDGVTVEDRTSHMVGLGWESTNPTAVVRLTDVSASPPTWLSDATGLRRDYTYDGRSAGSTNDDRFVSREGEPGWPEIGAKNVRYSPDQPRVPEGEHGGGQFAAGPGNAMRALLEANGGFSIDPASGKSPTDGYMVAIDGHSGVFDADRFMHDDKYMADSIMTWLRDKAEILDQPGMHIGGWWDKKSGKIVFDPSEHVVGMDEALRLGTGRNQVSVYDVVNKREIPTGGTGGYRSVRYSEGQARDDHGRWAKSDGLGEEASAAIRAAHLQANKARADEFAKSTGIAVYQSFAEDASPANFTAATAAIEGLRPLFPKVPLFGLQSKSMEPGTVAAESANEFGLSRIIFNTDYWSMEDRLDNPDTGFHVPGTSNAEGYTIHEFGHCVADELTASGHPLDPQGIWAPPSKYGAQDENELFAELFSEAFDPNAKGDPDRAASFRGAVLKAYAAGRPDKASRAVRYAPDQTRDDHGRFASEGGSGKPDIEAVVDQWVSGAIKGGDVPDGDMVIRALAATRGGGEPPKAVSHEEMDALAAKGWKMLYRGETQPKYADAFRDTCRYGTGMAANGTFAANSRPAADGGDEGVREATAYVQYNGVIYRMALDPSAKVLEWEDAERGADAEYRIYRKEWFDLKESGQVEASRRADARADIAYDPGRWAASQGYDAITAGPGGKGGHEYTVLLNYAKVRIEDRNLTKDEIEAGAPSSRRWA